MRRSSKRHPFARLQGEALLVRYADDLVAVFALEEDARRVMGVLPKRFGKYGHRMWRDLADAVWPRCEHPN